MQQIARPDHLSVSLLGFEVPKRSYYRARYYDPSVGRFISEDPIGFVGATDFFTYVSNSPLRYTDPLGLSQKDVQAILKQAQNSTDQMTKNGQRIDPGPLNNTLATLQYIFRINSPYLGCGEQTDRVASDLQFPQVPYDDHWTFSVHQWGWHQYGIPRPSNPNDPTIIFDPLKNQFFTTPIVTFPFRP